MRNEFDDFYTIRYDTAGIDYDYDRWSTMKRATHDSENDVNIY